MAQKLTGGLPTQMDLGQNWQIRFDAVDPTTGASVSGVTISATGMLVGLIGQTQPDQVTSGPFMLVPGPGA